jgi:hypothetical protein
VAFDTDLIAKGCATHVYVTVVRWLQFQVWRWCFANAALEGLMDESNQAQPSYNLFSCDGDLRKTGTARATLTAASAIVLLSGFCPNVSVNTLRTKSSAWFRRIARFVIRTTLTFIDDPTFYQLLNPQSPSPRIYLLAYWYLGKYEVSH